jgi:hypothetical protein
VRKDVVSRRFFLDKTGNISHPTLFPIFTLIEPNQTKKNLSFTLNSLLVKLKLLSWNSILADVAKWREVLGDRFEQRRLRGAH